MIRAMAVAETHDPESVFRRTMAGAADAIWDLTDDEHRVDDEALAALHDVIKRNERRRETLG
jgi:hypothetical protein